MRGRETRRTGDKAGGLTRCKGDEGRGEERRGARETSHEGDEVRGRRATREMRREGEVRGRQAMRETSHEGDEA